MNRLEEIKNNMETCTDWYVDNSLFLDDMKWLIQRLERYEKALQHIADRDNCYDDLPEIAQKSLKE